MDLQKRRAEAPLTATVVNERKLGTLRASDSVKGRRLVSWRPQSQSHSWPIRKCAARGGNYPSCITFSQQ